MGPQRNRLAASRSTDSVVLRREDFGPVNPAWQELMPKALRRQPAPRPSVWLPILAVVGLWLVLNARYGYHLEDSVLYLTLAKQQADPALYPDNPLVDHLRRMPYPLYRAMGWVLDGPLGPNGHIVATVAMRLGFVAVLLWFMTEVTARRWVGLIAAMAAVLQPAFYGTLAWTELISPEFVQSDLGKIALMLGVIAYLRGHLVGTAVVLGLAFHVHPIFALATAVMIAPDAVWRWRTFGPIRIVAAPLVGLLLAAPAAVGMIRTLSIGSAPAADGHVDMIRLFNYFHVLPTEFHNWEYVGFFGLAGAGAVALPMLAPRLGPRRGTFLRMTLGVGIWLAVGTVFVEWRPATLAMQMMPFRLTYAVRLFVTALVTLAAMDVLRRRQWDTFLLAVIWIACLAVGVKYLPWVTVLVACWQVVARRDRWAIAACVAAVLSAGAVAWIDPDQLPRLGNIVWPAFVVAIIACLILHLEQRGTLPPAEQEPEETNDWPASHAGRLALVVALPLATMIGLSPRGDGAWLPRLHVKPWLSPDGHRTGSDPWQNVMRWARQETEPTDLFITPPDRLGWTYYSERNTLASYQLAMQSVWDRRYAPIARARLEALAADHRWSTGPTYHAFDAQRLRELTQRYGVSYVVWRRDQTNRPPWRVAYENPAYLVYDVRSSATARTGPGPAPRTPDRPNVEDTRE